MSRPVRCPPELLGIAFRGVEAQQIGLLTKSQLRHVTWVRLLHGIYAHRDHAEDPSVRLQALRLAAAPGVVACGRTAAWLHGVWRPRPGDVVPLEVTKPILTTGVAVDGQRRRRLVLRATDGQRPLYGLSVLDDDVVAVSDVLVTSPIRTCFDLMRERRLVEAVVIADAFLFAGVLHREHLAAYCADRGRWPGVREARIAVSLADAASRSPGETRLRMVPVLAGLELPLVNVPVVDAYGRHLAIPDLQVRGRTWAWLEYDGAYHAESGQHLADLHRENRLSAHAPGIPVLRYERRDLIGDGPERILEELVRATGAAGATPLDLRDFWRPDRSRRW